jgi:bisphosphoglycerate-dependent phosphoglycerate mutase
MTSVSPNVDVYFVRHAESCSNISREIQGKVIHPPLSHEGIQQAINLGINNEIINMDFDKYYCSPSLRTIMTACLALRRKSFEKQITLYLNPYLIEVKNPAQYLSFFGSIYDDQQNSIVPIKNLQNMIKYIEFWFQYKYFDNFIDYEFIHLLYDLVLLLYYNDKLNIHIDIIKNLLSPIKPNRRQLLKDFLNSTDEYFNDLKPTNRIIIQNKIDKNIFNIYDNICLFIDNYNSISENFIIYQEMNSENKLDYMNIKALLYRFLDNTSYFNFDIQIDFTYKITDPNINTFINNEINKPELNNKKILCFTHGETLKRHFKLKHKLKNTEIVHYNHQTKNVEKIFNNNIVINKTLLKDTCGKTISENKMFQVINKYFNDEYYNAANDYDILEDYSTRIKKTDGDYELIGGKYKHKYLKYKHKYLNKKHLLQNRM